MTALPHPITLHNLSVRYDTDTIIAPLTHTFAAARWHVILGKSGVGKSTLLRAIAGLIPYDGTITRDPPGLMAQHDDLLPWRSARDNVTLGASLRGENADNSGAAQHSPTAATPNTHTNTRNTSPAVSASASPSPAPSTKTATCY